MNIWTLTFSYKMRCGKWCKNKVVTSIATDVRLSCKGTSKNVSVEANGKLDNSLSVGYHTCPGRIAPGITAIASLISWALNDCLLILVICSKNAKFSFEFHEQSTMIAIYKLIELSILFSECNLCISKTLLTVHRNYFLLIWFFRFCLITPDYLIMPVGCLREFPISLLQVGIVFFALWLTSQGLVCLVYIETLLYELRVICFIWVVNQH